MSADGPIFHTFNVERTDGSSAPGRKHDGCEYWVLDLTHDPAAIPALRAYAEAVRSTHPQLSAAVVEAADRARQNQINLGNQRVLAEWDAHGRAVQEITPAEPPTQSHVAYLGGVAIPADVLQHAIDQGLIRITNEGA